METLKCELCKKELSFNVEKETSLCLNCLKKCKQQPEIIDREKHHEYKNFKT